MTAYMVKYANWTYYNDNEMLIGYYSNYCRVKHAIMKHASKYMSFDEIRARIPEIMTDNYMCIMMDDKHDYTIEEINIE